MDPILLVIIVGVIIWALCAGRHVRQQGAPGEERVCPVCGTVNPPAAVFCRHCGTKLA